jgi:uncharacterized protein (DUF433 family)
MTVPKGLEQILKIDPNIMHGALCFTGTRVPLTIFLDNMVDGMSIKDFSRNYPSITREQIQAVIEWENAAIRQAAGLQLAS